ncbi:hypothetical protein HDU67_003460 [Dinochytrium kinnereticum]|nr:hypothetical protein HDU67_003460 [Dinochytrium kinnereticum]
MADGEVHRNLKSTPAFPEFDAPHITAVMDPLYCGNGYSKEALKAVLAHVFRAPSHPDSAVTVSPSSSPTLSLSTTHRSPQASMSRPMFFFGTGAATGNEGPGRIGIGTIESWSRDTGIGALAFTPPHRVSSSIAVEISSADDGFGNDVEVDEKMGGNGATAEKVLEGLGFVPTKRVACAAAGRFVRRRGYGAVFVRRDWMCWEMEREEFLDLWVG